jgi:phenol 2-monooxygenase
MVGDSTDAVWGVMDVYPRTSFPDIRKKAVINSAVGSLLIIPREGDSLVRFYIELPPGTKVADVTRESLHSRAKMIFQPYTMEIAETAWWSAYAIGQRHADRFAVANRVFLTGDACHTHSPKAGQGMNVSLQDGYNIGWKLGAVLTGRASKDLVDTYVVERAETAKELIEFDRDFTRIFSSKLRLPPDQVKEQFVKAGTYTAGQAVRYQESIITALPKTPEQQKLARKITVGMKFPSAQVVRYCDAKAIQMLNALPADGRWRVLIFAGDIMEKNMSERLATVRLYPDIDREIVRLETLLILHDFLGRKSARRDYQELHTSLGRR